MNLKSFKSCARGINDGTDFPNDLLNTLFRNINREPLAVHIIDRKKNIREHHAKLDKKSKLRLFKKETEKIVQISRH